ncbi:MAG: PQQ-binding-like beta-propeller repeat protein [Planctomycetota bacterium]
MRSTQPTLSTVLPTSAHPLFKNVSRIMCGPMLSMLLIVILSPHSASAQDWPELLGSGGTAQTTESVPSTWDEKNNLLWKLDLPGAGSSSPIVVGDRLFVTCYSRNGDTLTRYVICVDKKSGDKLWTKEFPAEYREDSYRGYIQEHGYASNTPVSDGKHLYVFLGKGGVHAMDFDGEVIWSRDVGKGSSNRQWGSAASLLLYKDSVIVNASEESKAIIGLNKADGKVIWKQAADLLELSYGTPRLVELSSGRSELVISVPSELWGLNPASGKLRWYTTTPMTGNVSPSVIVDGENVYSFGGYRSSGSVSVKAGGKGDVTKSNLNWTSRSTSYVATPLIHDGRFYWIDDKGLANCSDVSNGKQIYRTRVKGLSGRPVYASPIMADGKIYVVTRQFGTIVYAPGDEFKIISQNSLAGDNTDFNATPAISDSRLYLRSNQALYCIAEEK